MRKMILCGALITAMTAAHAGEEEGDRISGHAFAQDVCADCHYVEADEPAILYTDVKPFRLIADDPKTTALSLRVFLQTPHQEMPDFILSKQQTDDVIAYILSLRGAE